MESQRMNVVNTTTLAALCALIVIAAAAPVVDVANYTLEKRCGAGDYNPACQGGEFPLSTFISNIHRRERVFNLVNSPVENIMNRL